jgi:hypothetical protein
MAVISGLVGAEGLGGQVTSAIATLDLGLGFEAGLAVVILAIYLDRVTAGIGQGTHKTGLARLLSRKQRPAVEEEVTDEEVTDELAEESPVAEESPQEIDTTTHKIGG